MPEITWSFDLSGGTEPRMKISGIKGKGCQPIHDLIAKDFAEIGVANTSSESTPEAYERETVNETNRMRLRQ